MASPATRRPTALIADDEPVLRDELAALLAAARAASYRTLSCSRLAVRLMVTEPKMSKTSSMWLPRAAR